MIHAVYDLTDCACPDPAPDELLASMNVTAALLGCTVIGELPVTYPQYGITCFLALAESHLTVSTWPEYRLAHLDLFTCRADIDPDQAIQPIVMTLGSASVHSQRIVRAEPVRTP